MLLIKLPWIEWSLSQELINVSYEQVSVQLVKLNSVFENVYDTEVGNERSSHQLSLWQQDSGQPDEDQNEQQQEQSANQSSDNAEIAHCLIPFSHPDETMNSYMVPTSQNGKKWWARFVLHRESKCKRWS